MDPSYNNSLDGFGSGAVMNNTGLPQNDIVINPVVEPKKRFNWKIIVALLSVAIVAVIIIFVAMAVMSGQGASREEVYSKLRDFYYGVSYQDLVEGYDSVVGKTPHLQGNDNETIFPVRDVWISREVQLLESLRLAHTELAGFNLGNLSSDERKEFDSIIYNAKKTMDSIEVNLAILSDFYDAFMVPLDALYRSGASVSCVQTEKISDLINNSDVSDAAGIYFSAYCKAIEAYSKIGDRETLQVEILELVDEALGLLDEALKNIDNTSENEIERLLSELSQ